MIVCNVTVINVILGFAMDDTYFLTGHHCRDNNYVHELLDNLSKHIAGNFKGATHGILLKLKPK